MEKGFSLVELIVVVVILAVIALVSVPVVNNIINDSKEKSYMEQERSIVAAARTYMTSHSSELPSSTAATKCVTVSDLKTEGLLKDEAIKNPVGKDYKLDASTIYKERSEQFDGGVLVTYNGTKYTYTYIDSCSDADFPGTVYTDGGSSGFTPTQAFTGTIYGSNGNEFKIGDSVVPGVKIVWIIRNVSEGYTMTPYVFDTKAECQEKFPEWNLSSDEWSCQSKAVGVGAGGYKTSSSQVGKNYYLKHEVVNGIVTASYACVFDDQEYCLKGGPDASFDENEQVIRNYQTTHPSNTCWFHSYESTCRYGNFDLTSYGSMVVVFAKDGGNCQVFDDGKSWCGPYEAGFHIVY